MRGNRYDREWRQDRGYDAGFTGRARRRERGPEPRYDSGIRGRYDREWTEGVAFGRGPGMGMNGAGMFTPFGWDPMLRWSGWDPLMGFVPYQDAPREWSYGLAEDYRRYGHDYFRDRGPRSYDRGYEGGGPPRLLPPRRSPLYGRGGDRGLREWARAHGYDVEHTIQPRPGRRR